MRKRNKTFSLDEDVLAEIKRTQGASSESERDNSLLKSPLDLEKKGALRDETAAFFSGDTDDRTDRFAYETAAVSPWTRD